MSLFTGKISWKEEVTAWSMMLLALGFLRFLSYSFSHPVSGQRPQCSKTVTLNDPTSASPAVIRAWGREAGNIGFQALLLLNFCKGLLTGTHHAVTNFKLKLWLCMTPLNQLFSNSFISIIMMTDCLILFGITMRFNYSWRFYNND